MAETDFSKGELIRQGWGATKSNASLFLQLAVIYVLFSLLTGAVQGLTVELHPALALLISLASTVIDVIIQIGFIKVALDIVDGKKPTWRSLYENYKLFIPFFLTSLLFGAIVLVGFILLIIPGIYLAVKYQFTPYVVIDKGTAYLAAIKEAGKLTQGRWMSVFLFDLTMIGVILLGALALGVGLLIAIPVVFLASAFLYRKLSK